MPNPNSLGQLDAQHTRGRYGPYEASGAFYVVARREGANTHRLRMMRATDPTATWTAQDTANEPTAPSNIAFTAVAAFLSGTTIFVVGEVIDTSAMTNVVRVRLWEFNTANNTWGSAQTVADADYNGFTFLSAGSSLDVVVDGAGTILVLHHGAYTFMGSDFVTVSISRKPSGGSFSTQQVGPGSNAQRARGCLVRGTSNRTHIFYLEAANSAEVFHRAINSGGTLQNESSVFSGTGAIRYVTHGPLVGSVGNVTFRNNASVWLRRAHFTSADNPTFTVENVSTEEVYQFTGNYNRHVGHQIEHDGTDYHQLSILASNQNLRYAKRDASSWPAPSDEHTGVTNRYALSVEHSGGKLRALWADPANHFPVYYEKSFGATVNESFSVEKGAQVTSSAAATGNPAFAVAKAGGVASAATAQAAAALVVAAIKNIAAQAAAETTHDALIAAAMQVASEASAVGDAATALTAALLIEAAAQVSADAGFSAEASMDTSQAPTAESTLEAAFDAVMDTLFEGVRAVNEEFAVDAMPDLSALAVVSAAAVFSLVAQKGAAAEALAEATGVFEMDAAAEAEFVAEVAAHAAALLTAEADLLAEAGAEAAEGFAFDGQITTDAEALALAEAVFAVVSAHSLDTSAAATAAAEAVIAGSAQVALTAAALITDALLIAAAVEAEFTAQVDADALFEVLSATDLSLLATLSVGEAITLAAAHTLSLAAQALVEANFSASALATFAAEAEAIASVEAVLPIAIDLVFSENIGGVVAVELIGGIAAVATGLAQIRAVALKANPGAAAAAPVLTARARKAVVTAASEKADLTAKEG